MLMDDKTAYNLFALKNYGRDKSRSLWYVAREIGRYRLEAEKQNGFIRSYIHHQANVLEKKMGEAKYHFLDEQEA